MKPNLIDRAVAYISPQAGARRMAWRATMAAASHYDGASGGRRTKGWKSPGGDVNTATRSGKRLRNVARDMARNNAIAKRACSAIANNVVGDGIIPNVECEDAERRKRVQDVIWAHTDTTNIDAHGRLTLYGMQRLAVENMVMSGEALLRYRPRFSSDRLPMNFQLEALEPEHLDDRHVGILANGNNAYDGIEYNQIGRRVAYRIFRDHPEGMFNGYPESFQVAANRIIHLYRVDRPGQRRGVSWLAPCLSMMADAYDYADAQLLRQKIAAMWVAFTRDTMPDGPDQSQEGFDATTLTPGMFEHLPHGREVVFSDPPKVDGYSEHMRTVLRMVATALDVTYEELSGDLTGVNFSSSRLGRIPMRSAVTAVQWHTVIPVLCDPIGKWLKEEALAKLGGADDFQIRWTPPILAMADPSREVPPIVQQIGAGLISRREAIREMGYDPDTTMADIARDREDAEAVGVVFEGAPVADEGEVTDGR